MPPIRCSPPVSRSTAVSGSKRKPTIVASVAGGNRNPTPMPLRTRSSWPLCRSLNRAVLPGIRVRAGRLRCDRSFAKLFAEFVHGTWVIGICRPSNQASRCCPRRPLPVRYDKPDYQNRNAAPPKAGRPQARENGFRTERLRLTADLRSATMWSHWPFTRPLPSASPCAPRCWRALLRDAHRICPGAASDSRAQRCPVAQGPSATPPSHGQLCRK
jgi:hypothetical protein